MVLFIKNSLLKTCFHLKNNAGDEIFLIYLRRVQVIQIQQHIIAFTLNKKGDCWKWMIGIVKRKTQFWKNKWKQDSDIVRFWQNMPCSDSKGFVCKDVLILRYLVFKKLTKNFELSTTSPLHGMHNLSGIMWQWQYARQI